MALAALDSVLAFVGGGGAAAVTDAPAVIPATSSPSDTGSSAAALTDRFARGPASRTGRRAVVDPRPQPSGASILRTSLAENRWDAATRSQVESMSRTVLGLDWSGDPTGRPATPLAELEPQNGSASTSRYAAYSNGTDQARRITVSGVGAKGTLKLRILIPVSGHVGRIDGDAASYDAARANSKAYADNNRAAVWVRYVPLDAAGNIDDALVPGEVPNPEQLAGRAPLVNGRVLAAGLRCPENRSGKPYDKHVVTVVEVDVPLRKGAGTIVLLDPAVGESGGPGGFHAGRTLQIVWDGT